MGECSCSEMSLIIGYTTKYSLCFIQSLNSKTIKYDSLQNVVLCTYCFDVTKKHIQKTAHYGSSAGHLMQVCNYTAPEPERFYEAYQNSNVIL